MSYPMAAQRPHHDRTQLGGNAFNHSQSSSDEAEYDRLRSLARDEAAKRSSCFDRAHQAYERGDGSSAHNLSEEGKKHAAQMDAYNQQASDYIFRSNNAHVASDTIDLHGQFVDEAERIVETRLRAGQQRGESHLHVIVGKGNHSVDHVQKIKPAVEKICQELGLQYATEENAGRMFVNLQGGQAVMPDLGSNGGYSQGYGGANYGNQQYQGGPYQGGQQQHGGQQHGGQQHGGQQNNNANAEIEAAVQKLLPRLLRALEKNCCTIM